MFDEFLNSGVPWVLLNLVKLGIGWLVFAFILSLVIRGLENKET